MSTAPIVYSLADDLGDVSADPSGDRAAPDVDLVANVACRTSGGATAAKSEFPRSKTTSSQ